MELNEVNTKLVKLILADVLEDLSATELAVLLCLGAFTSTKTGRCNPSQSELAAKARMTTRSVVRALSRLEAKGYIVRQAAYRDDGGRAPCNYIVNTDRLPQL
jgi:DNA-binding MarR family transcriptional regulator